VRIKDLIETQQQCEKLFELIAELLKPEQATIRYIKEREGRAHDHDQAAPGSALSGSVRRASLDLTRQLARMRKP